MLTAQTQTIDVSSVDSVIFVISAFGYDTINSEFSMRIIKNSSVELASDMELIPISNQYSLNNPYPNPFNAHITIHYTIPINQPVDIAIYDILGNKIRRFQSEQLGMQSIIWNGKDQYGIPVSSGMYIVNMSTESFTQSRRILLLK